jgi:hypothetical protein
VLDSGVHDLPRLTLRIGIRGVGTKPDQAETAALLPASGAEDSVLPSHHHGVVRPDQRAWPGSALAALDAENNAMHLTTAAQESITPMRAPGSTLVPRV